MYPIASVFMDWVRDRKPNESGFVQAVDEVPEALVTHLDARTPSTGLHGRCLEHGGGEIVDCAPRRTR